MDMAEAFLELAENWVEDTADIENMTEKCFNPYYTEIIGMGSELIPFLLAEIVEELRLPKGRPDKWFWALRQITHDNPVPERFGNKPKKAGSCWLHWGRNHGFETTIEER